jgi:putative FmdB family regulatory protein
VPTYQYACTACGHRFEAVQSFSDASLTDCPECAGRLRKVFSSVGIVFKGSGFYRTDSRSSGSDGGAEKKAEKTSDTSGGDSGSSTKKADSDKKSPAAKSDSGSTSSSSTTKKSTTATTAS